MEYRSLSEKAKPVLFITAAVQALLFAAVPCAILWLAMFDGAVLTKPLCMGITLCLCALALAWAVFAPIVRFRRYRYKLAEDRIEIQEGIFYIRRTMVPIDRIHQIDIVRGPLDSRFGLAKVTVTTAGGTATMRFLELEKAEDICQTLNRTVTRKLRKSQGEDHV